MSVWARRPPSERKVRFVFAIIAVCLLLFGYERLFGWPDWLTVNSDARGRFGY
jgi:hypothetical protein